MREPFNFYSHLLGAILSIFGLLFLIVCSYGNSAKVISFSIYGMSLVLLYTASALYHAFDKISKHITLLRRLDHVAIFVLIAGSSTPLCTIVLSGWLGYGLLFIIWAIACIGIVQILLFFYSSQKSTQILYLSMGWLFLLAIVQLIEVLGIIGFIWLLIGGILYTVGAIILLSKRPNPFPAFFGYHEFFHVLTLGGSISHYYLMIKYVLPIEHTS